MFRYDESRQRKKLLPGDEGYDESSPDYVQEEEIVIDPICSIGKFDETKEKREIRF